MFKFLKKKTRVNVENLSQDDKFLVEEMLDEGNKPKEISDATGLDYQLVFRHYKLLHKREERREQKSVGNPEDIERILDKQIRIKQKTSILKALVDPDDEDEDEDPLDTDQGMFTELMKFLNKTYTPPIHPPNSSGIGLEELPPSYDLDSSSSSQTLTELQIREILAGEDPKLLKKAKKMDPETLKTLIRNKYPLNEETIEKALVIINEK